jgi:hypothetical protein
VLAQVVDALDIDGQVGVRGGRRECDGPELVGRQPLSVASNIDDRFCYSLARVPGSRVLSLQAHSPHSGIGVIPRVDPVARLASR